MKRIINNKIIIHNISDAEQRKLAIKVLARKILELYEHQNNLTKTSLYLQVYRKKYIDDNECWFRWQFILKALRYLRKNTRIFIVNKLGFYRVVENKTDINEYLIRLDDIIVGCKRMKIRANKAVKENWYIADYDKEIKKIE